MEFGFDSREYVRLQREAIEQRCASGRLYLEVGGHLFYDAHASRVLPGFDPRNKLHVLKGITVKSTVVVCCHARLAVENSPVAATGELYQDALMNVVASLSSSGLGLGVGNVVVTRCDLATQGAALEMLRDRVKDRFPNVHFHLHAAIPGYPSPDAALAGFALNSQLVFDPDTALVIVSGVQSNSGKLGTCLSQLYHDKTALYSKLELFPIWSLPVSHPVNRAYEAATADLLDIVCEDPFHNERATNYNRDVEAFPIVKLLMEGVLGASNPMLERYYRSPTSMGLNFAGFCITNNALCVEASIAEIARRSLQYADNAVAQKRCIELLLTTVGQRALSVEVEFVDEIMTRQPTASSAEVAQALKTRLVEVLEDRTRYIAEVLPAVRMGVLAGFHCALGTFFLDEGHSLEHWSAASHLLFMAAGCADGLAEKVWTGLWQVQHCVSVVFDDDSSQIPVAPHLTTKEALPILASSAPSSKDFVRALWNSHMHFNNRQGPSKEEAEILRSLGVIVTDRG